MSQTPKPRKTPAPKARDPNLPDSELLALRVLWEKQRATAREVWLALRESGSTWSYATVNTLLQRLEAKGLAVSDKSQMSYVYTPRITRTKVVKNRVKDLVDKLYDGKGGMLVLHLLKSQRFSAEEMSEIHEALDDARRGANPRE